MSPEERDDRRPEGIDQTDVRAQGGVDMSQVEGDHQEFLEGGLPDFKKGQFTASGNA